MHIDNKLTVNFLLNVSNEVKLKQQRPSGKIRLVSVFFHEGHRLPHGGNDAPETQRAATPAEEMMSDVVSFGFLLTTSSATHEARGGRTVLMSASICSIPVTTAATRKKAAGGKLWPIHSEADENVVSLRLWSNAALTSGR